MSWGPGRPNRKFDVKSLRKRLGLSQFELAAQIPTSERTVRRWERQGIAPQRFYIQRLLELEEERFGTITSRPVLRSRTGTFAKQPRPVEPDPPLHVGVLPSSFFV